MCRVAAVFVMVLASRLLMSVGGGGSFTVLEIRHALFNGENGDGVYAIGAATRTGGTWSEYVSNPVLEKGSGGAWDDDHVKDPHLLWDGSQYVMYFAGYDGTTYQVGRATATSHEGPWTKYASNPVVAVGSGGAIDDAGVAFPTVLYEPADTGNEWKMWYRADDGSTQVIAYAHSTDGISWTKAGMVIDVGAAAAWNDEGVLPGAIVKDGATYNLFVGGRQGTTNPRWQGGLYTFTDPEGTYTANGGNPIILARFNDGSGTSQTPTSDTTPGTAVVAVATPGAYNSGEPVVLLDGDTTAEIFYITAIGASSVTLDRNVTGTFTAAQGHVLRSFAYNAVVARSVLARTDGGYEAFVTPFQPVEDLTQPASKLWEGSFEMRADALTGTWAYYYVAGRGLLFPLSIGAAWHSRSAENPSVIAAP